MNPPCAWVHLRIPPSLERMRIVQDAACNLAAECGFPAERQRPMELAIEEVITTILRYITDEADVADAVLDIRMKVDAPVLRVSIVNEGLPFDLSEVPEYDAGQLSRLAADSDSAAASGGIRQDHFSSGLALFLLKKATDRCQIQYRGKEGNEFCLEWFFPGAHIAEQAGEEATELAGAAQTEAAAAPPEPIGQLRVLTEADAIGFCRLMYRSYGSTYPNADFYFPERVRAHQQSGRIKSWGAVTPSGRVVGHLALMKDSPAAPAVEWGAVVVDPLWRSEGLMKKLLAAAIESMGARTESVLYAHAVTSHPYTQKTCNRFGFAPTALLLGFIVDNIRFRGIQENAAYRETIFVASRIFRALPRQRLYPPPWHRDTIARLLAGSDLSLAELAATADDEAAAAVPAQSTFATTTIASINIAILDVPAVGADFAAVLGFELRRLCRARVDVIYLTLDLADPNVVGAVKAAEELGFFLGGWLPMQPFAYGLTFQYLNTTKVDFKNIATDGEQATWLKGVIQREQQRIEHGLYGGHAPGACPD